MNKYVCMDCGALFDEPMVIGRCGVDAEDPPEYVCPSCHGDYIVLGDECCICEQATQDDKLHEMGGNLFCESCAKEAYDKIVKALEESQTYMSDTEIEGAVWWWENMI